MQLIAKFQGKWRRTLSRRLARRDLAFRLERPIVSFTFDDFPKNAATEGARILKDSGVTATYYVSMGLLGTTAPTGRIADPEDLPPLLAAGHELGCHTFDHRHAWETSPRIFAQSIDRNQEEVARIVAGCRLETMSYPISEPRPANKRVASRRFAGCRAGGQALNLGVLDRNCLKAYFLEQARGRLEAIEAVVEENRRANGWLIFATHDIDEQPTPFGCTPAFFRAAVECAVRSKAEILPVATALRQIAGVP